MPSSISKNQTARYEVTVCGEKLTQDDAKGLQYVLVEDHVDMVGMAELGFDAGGGLKWSKMKIGGDVEIKFGGSNFKVFVGKVTGLRHQFREGFEQLTVIAMDPLVHLYSSRKTRVFEDSKDSAAVSAVLGESEAVAGTVEGTSETHKYIFQRNESDALFLRRLAARNGYHLMANEGKVDFKKPAFSAGPIEVAKSDLVSMSYSFADKWIPKNLTVYGWDYVTKKMVKGKAGKGEVVSIGGGENAAGKTGQIWQADSYDSDVWVNSDAGAKERAVAEYNRIARNFLRGKATVQGNGEIHAGVRVKFIDHAEGFNPDAFVVGSRHRVYMTQGHFTEFLFLSNTYPGA